MRAHGTAAGLASALALIFASPQSSPTSAANPEPGITFLITFGERRTGVRPYDGSIATTGGKLVRLLPWRFFGDDRIAGPDSWKLTIKRGPMENQPDRPVTIAEGAVTPSNLVPAGLLVTVTAGTNSAAIRTSQGDFTVPLADLRYGRPLWLLDGDVRVERSPETARLSSEESEEHDYPALTATRAGDLWYAWQAYRDRGDHIYVRDSGGAVTRLTTDKADVFRPAIAEDAQGRIHVVWAEREGDDWNLIERVHTQGRWSPRARIAGAGTPNFYQRLVASPAGRLHLVWVGHEAGNSYLYTSEFDGARWSPPVRAGGPSVWRPDAAVDPKGNLHLAWDSYQNGSYDIFYRDGPSGKTETVAASPRFQAHASLAIDAEGRPWLAWDESGANWGKDWNRQERDRGTTLYSDRTIRVAVRTAAGWMQPAEFTSALPDRTRATCSCRASPPTEPAACGRCSRCAPAPKALTTTDGPPADCGTST